MNDFTKAELETIKYWCQLEPNITKKIQSMIDNYCEHEHLDFVGDVNGYCCKKCDKQFDYKYVDDERHERIVNGEDY